MISAVNGEASIADSVGFGFGKLFQHLRVLTILGLPFIIIASVIMGIESSKLLKISDLNIFNFCFLNLGFIGYFFYILLRYSRDVINETVNPKIYQYLIPDKTLWGVLCIHFLPIAVLVLIFSYLFVSFAIYFIQIFLIVLIISIPAIYFLLRFHIALYRYMQQPEHGIKEAYLQSWQLTKGNEGRILIPLIIVGILWLMAMNISSVIFIFVALLSRLFFPTYLIGSIVQSPLFCPIFIIQYALIYWLQLVVIGGSGIFIMYRLQNDLLTRKANTIYVIPKRH